MIDNIFSHQYSHYPGYELSMDQLMSQVNSGGVGTVRRLELELMQAGKVRRKSATFLFPKKAHLHAWVANMRCKHCRLISRPTCFLTNISKLFDKIPIIYTRKGPFSALGQLIIDAASKS
jgi:hypothetical protein